MVILVTGGSGFIGRRLVARLSLAGYEVIALSRGVLPDELIKLPRVSWLASDIVTDNLKALNLPQIDAVVHLAGATLGAGRDESMFLSANELTTVRLCQAFAEKTDRFIYASSQAVYGNPKNLAVDESFVLQPDFSAYACSKVNSENWLRWYQQRYGGQYVALRLCGFIEGGGIIDYIIDKCLAGETIELFAGGMIKRDYLPVEKAIDVFMAALDYKGASGFLPVNIGSGQPISAHELAEMICTEMKSRSSIDLFNKAAPQGDFIYNIKLARNIFNFCPGSLADAIRSYARQRWQGGARS